jgi:hypothetical protein
MIGEYNFDAHIIMFQVLLYQYFSPHEKYSPFDTRLSLLHMYSSTVHIICGVRTAREKRVNARSYAIGYGFEVALKIDRYRY